MTASVLVGAQPDAIFTHAQTINEDRYEDYDGTPYWSKSWPLVDIYDAGGLVLGQLAFNINGFSNEIEIRKGDRFIELDKIAYTKLITTIDGLEVIFKRGFHEELRNDFVEVIYEGSQIKMARKFRAEVTEKEFNDVGKNIMIKRFDRKFKYFLIKNDTLEVIKLKKKLFLNQFENKKEIDQFMSKNKLKLSSIVDLKEILAFAEKSF